MNATDSEFLTQFLADRDIPCPSCEYNLRGLTGSHCPECGEAIVLRIGLAEPKIAGAMTGVIGLAAGAGLNGLLVGFALIQILFMHRSYGFKTFLIITGLGLLVEGSALVIWLRAWRLIRRQKISRQVTLAIGAWLLTLIDLVIFSVFVR